MRREFQEWVFGCDLCQEVCPWNQKANRTSNGIFHTEFEPNSFSNPTDLLELFPLSEEAFQNRFRQTPLSRAGRSGILRNAALILGARKLAIAIPMLIEALDDCDAIVRGAVAWALGEIGGEHTEAALQSRRIVGK